jgi:hypothetical protein
MKDEGRRLATASHAAATRILSVEQAGVCRPGCCLAAGRRSVTNMLVPERLPAANQDSRDRASVEIDLLTRVARLRAAASGEQRAAVEVSGMIGRLGHEELAGLLTAAILRLALDAGSSPTRQ